MKVVKSTPPHLSHAVSQVTSQSYYDWRAALRSAALINPLQQRTDTKTSCPTTGVWCHTWFSRGWSLTEHNTCFFIALGLQEKLQISCLLACFHILSILFIYHITLFCLQGGRSALSLATQASHTEIADLLKARAESKSSDKCKVS